MMDEYKETLWRRLWTYKYKAKQLSEQHEVMFVIHRRFKLLVDVMTTILTALTTILASMQTGGNYDSTILILTISTTVLKVVEESSSLSDKILQYNRSSKNYNFIFDEIKRIMTLKQTTIEFREAIDILSDLFVVFDQNAEPVWEWVERNYVTIVPPLPSIQQSPEVSIVTV